MEYLFTGHNENHSITHPLTEIGGIRLQPIVDFNKNQTIAREVLSILHTQNPESFFEKLTPELHLQVLVWQIHQCEQVNGYRWFNIPVALLMHDELFFKLALIPASGRTALEIQDPVHLLSLTPGERQCVKRRIRMLQHRNWLIILDDLEYPLAAEFIAYQFKFDVVKTDKTELKSADRLNLVIQQARLLASYVVVEGIENKDHLRLARASKADAGQGYLWPERSLECPGITDNPLIV